MQQLIFKNFSSGSGSSSLAVISDYIDTDNIERIFSDYQETVYAGQSRIQMVCPSFRLKHVSQDDYSINSLLQHMNTLTSLLDGLGNIKLMIRENYERLSSWRKIFYFFHPYSAEDYNRAYARIAQVYESVLIEANILAQVVSSKINSWAFENKPFVTTKKESYSYNLSSENIFMRACKTLGHIQNINQKFHENNKRARADHPHSDPLSRWVEFKRNTSGYLDKLGLNEFSLVQLVKDSQSFWLKRRYKSKLFFLKTYYSRILKSTDENYESKWGKLVFLSKEVESTYNKLNSLFHRHLKKSYKEFSGDVDTLQIQLAKGALKITLQNVNQKSKAIIKNKVFIFSIIKKLPLSIQNSWSIFYNGLVRSREIVPTLWENSLQDLYDYLEISSVNCFELAQFFVMYYIAKGVISSKHSAYSLLVRYTSIRYDEPIISKPKMMPLESKKSQRVFNSIVDSVFTSVNKLYELSQRKDRVQLGQLLDLNLTRDDLLEMIQGFCDEPHFFQEKNRLIVQLNFIETTLFSSQYCKKQATYLVQLLENKPLKEKITCVDDYINLISVRSLHGNSVFGSSSSTLHVNEPAHLSQGGIRTVLKEVAIC